VLIETHDATFGNTVGVSMARSDSKKSLLSEALSNAEPNDI
jgi:hypothetical protein